jgi:hypothetical protein
MPTLRFIALLVCLTLPLGCMPVQSTKADVFRYLAPAKVGGPIEFGACTIHLGWDEDRLTEECGPPDQVIAHKGESCLVYKTLARSISGYHAPAAAYVVCLQTKVGVTKTTRKVASVHGVSEVVLTGGPTGEAK